MKTFSDKTKDLFYDMIDYIIIIAVIICVVGIIDWRLGIVFDKKIAAVEFSEESNSAEVIEEIESATTNELESNDQPITVSIDVSDSTTPLDSNVSESSEVVSKSVEIPSGSSSQKIGQILVDSRIISDKQVFLTRAAELHLDTKLQSGTFELSSDMKLDNIIKKIAGQS